MAERVLRIAADLALPLAIAGEAIAVLATRGAGKSYTSAVLVEELHAAGVQLVVLDPTGVYWGLRSSDDGKAAGLALTILGGAHGDVPLEPTAGKLIADVIVDTGQSLILDLSDFETKGAQTRFITDLVERLYHRKARARTTLHLVIDEANEFAPQRPMPDERRMLGAMERLVGKGRSRGLAATLITQRSAALNKNVLDLVDTLIAMRVLGPRDRKAIDDWIVVKQQDDDLGVVESLPSLPTGTAWVWSPVRGILQKVAIRRIRTFDSYRTPEPGEARIEPTARAPIDVAQLGEQIKATAERAEASDPKKLQARIRVLEGELTLAQGAAGETIEVIREVAVPVHVEVPVLNGQVDDLRAVVTSLVDVGERIMHVGANITAAIDRVTVAALAPAPLRARPVQMAIPPAPTPIRPRAITAAEDRVLTYTLRPTERAILSVLAQWPEGRTQKQVATLAGYSPKSGGFFGALSNLRKLTAIEGSIAGLRITADGRQIIGDDYDPLPSGDALREHWYAKLPKAEATILRALVEAFPASLSQEQLAERTGYSGTSGGFFGALAKLRTLELISGGKPALLASEDLF